MHYEWASVGRMTRVVNALSAASQATRDELLEAGLRLLMKLPASAAFGHLTAQRIAGEAGRTTGAFFHQWPTLEAYLQDFVAYVLRPELSVNLQQTSDEISRLLREGGGFTDAVIEAASDVPQRTARDPQTVIELLMANRALHDPEFRSRVTPHYGTLDDGAAPIFEALMTLVGRQPRPPFTAQTIAAIYSAVAQGLSLRAALTPGFYPDRTYGWVVLALVPLLTRTPDDDRDASSWVSDLPLRLQGSGNGEPAERIARPDSPDLP